MKALPTLLLLAVASGSVWANPFEVRWDPATVDQGGIVRVHVVGPDHLARPSGTFAGKAMRFFPGAALGVWVGHAAADLSARPGTLALKVTAEGQSRSMAVPIAKGNYKEERLTLPPGKVNPRAKKVLDQIWGDRKRAKAAGLVNRDLRFPGVLRLPSEGRLNHNFGKRRILNGTPKSPHGGEDISAPMGTPVLAAAAGEIRLVDDMFYSGKTLFLDHGAGWMSTYFHLSEITVQAGQQVAAGELIGKVGKSGRATGPHLHWGLQWLRSRVNPLLLVPNQGVTDAHAGLPAAR